MTPEEEIISNTSYTSLDFRSIYPQLLDTAKKLTNTWDPSLSNESDPGNVLIKEAAIIGDKVNYHVDKNVLECFPLSATQQSSARQIYDLVGYNMHWYQSAKGFATFKLLRTPEAINESLPYIQIKAGTIICDNSGEYVYTLLEPTDFMTATNTIYTAPIIQGTITPYEINGEKIITVDNLDENLRIYFPNNIIAQNGIFVYDANDSAPTKFDNTTLDTQSTSWALVDNLTKYPSGSKVFKFGLDLNNDNCYIQFPEDILSSGLIGSGLNIYYTTTLGQTGNLKDSIINKFLTDYNVPINDSTDTIPVNDYIVVSNKATIGGTDPESLQEAYRNYKKLVGTYETLVTRRDYENAIYGLVDSENLNSLVANDIVSDRTTDINYSQKVIETNLSTDYAKNYVVQHTVNDVKEDMMKPYDIALYLFRQPSSMLTVDNYNESFTPNLDETTRLSIEQDLDDLKSVQHNLYYIRDIGNISESEKDSLYFNINNICKLTGTLTTYYKVTKEEAKEIENNVVSNLIAKYNSRQIDFGNELDYNDLVTTIKNSDDRIRNLSLNTPVYEPYLQYATNDGTLKSLYESEQIDINNETLAKMILAGKVQPFKFEEDFQYDFGQVDGVTYTGVSSISTNNPIKITSNGLTINRVTTKLVYTYDGNFVEVKPGESYNSNILYFASNTLPYNPANAITDIDSFTKQVYESGIENIAPLNKNDIVQIISPNLITSATYEPTVKYSSNFSCSANTVYVLGTDDILKCVYVDSATGAWVPKIYRAGTIIEPVGFNLSADNNFQNTDAWLNDVSSVKTTIKANESIKILAISKITINANTPYYIITQNTTQKSDGEYYSLTLNANSEYILKENEYLLYTNSNLDGVVVLGSGTSIICENKIDLESKVLELSDVMATDVSEAKSAWGNLPKDINAQENSIVSLSEGDRIALVDDSSHSEPVEVECENEPQEIPSTASGFVYKLISDDDVKQVIIPLNMNRTYYNIRYRSNIVLTGNYIVPQKLVGSQEIIIDSNTYKASDNYSVLYSYPLNMSGGDDINVKVLDSNTGKYEALLSVYFFKQQSMASGLNDQDINIARTNQNKSLVISATDGVDKLNFTFNPSSFDYGYYLLPTSFTVPSGALIKLSIADGTIGDFISVIDNTASDSLIQESIADTVLVINANNSFNNIKVDMGYNYTKTGNTYTIVNNGTDVEFTLSGTTLEYDEDDNTYDYVKDGSTNIYKRDSLGQIELVEDPNDATKGYMLINDKDFLTLIKSPLTVAFGYIKHILSYNSDEINCENIAFNYFNYKIENEFDKNIGISVLEAIKNIYNKLDNPNYDWAYSVPATNKVLQPLSGEAYFNSNHIYNAYTLPKIDFSQSNIKVNPSSIK